MEECRTRWVKRQFGKRANDICMPGYLIRVRLVVELLPECLSYCLKSEPCGASGRTCLRNNGVKHLSTGNEHLLGLTLGSPLAEQHEIVRRVETLFAFADRLEARLAAARAQVEGLTPSLLAKAFRGELDSGLPEAAD